MGKFTQEEIKFLEEAITLTTLFGQPAIKSIQTSVYGDVKGDVWGDVEGNVLGLW